MSWNLEEAISFYQTQGAPGDQIALVSLLKEIQQEQGCISRISLGTVAQSYAVKESYLTALIRRIPGLRLDGRHVLEICAGPNCSKHTSVAAFAETLDSTTVTVKSVPCMHLCGKGPNIRLDGKHYHKADPALLRQLLKD